MEGVSVTEDDEVRLMSVFEQITPEQRSLRARIAAYAKWARTADRAGATAPARRAFLSRFEAEVDPEGKLPPDVRARLAASARKAYFAALAYHRVKAQARNGGA